MGSLSITQWVILAIILFFPVYFVVSSKPPGPNRYGDVPPALNFVESVASFFKNYANFKGRASRSAYWWVTLLSIIAAIAFNWIDPTGTLNGITTLVIFIPSIAIGARRLHDTNRSGWYQLLMLFLPVGTIALLVWTLMPPSEGKR